MAIEIGHTEEEIKKFVETRVRGNQTAIWMNMGHRGFTLKYTAKLEEAQKILDFIRGIE